MKNSTLRFIAIIASTILVTQVIPAEAAGSEARKQTEEVNKRADAAKETLRIKMINAMAAWKTASEATDTARETWKQNKTDANRDALSAAKVAEKNAYDAFKKALKDFKKFRGHSVKNDTAEVANEKKQVSAKRQAIIDAKLDLKVKRDALEAAKETSKTAEKNWKKDKTAANFTLWKTAEQNVSTAKQAFENAKQALKDARKAF